MALELLCLEGKELDLGGFVAVTVEDEPDQEDRRRATWLADRRMLGTAGLAVVVLPGDDRLADVVVVEPETENIAGMGTMMAARVADEDAAGDTAGHGLVALRDDDAVAVAAAPGAWTGACVGDGGTTAVIIWSCGRENSAVSDAAGLYFSSSTMVLSLLGE